MDIKITNVNLDFYLKNPNLIGEHCYKLRKSLSSYPDDPVPKTFFANLLNCKVVDIARIESGTSCDTALSLRYLLTLDQLKQIFKT